MQCTKNRKSRNFLPLNYFYTGLFNVDISYLKSSFVSYRIQTSHWFFKISYIFCQHSFYQKKLFAAFHSVAVKRRCASSGEGIQDGLSRWLSWSGVQHHETVLEPRSCCSTKLSDVEGVATTYQQRHGKKTLMEMTEQTRQVAFFFSFILTIWTITWDDKTVLSFYLWVLSLTLSGSDCSNSYWLSQSRQ